jgi:hypothetical protein
MSSDPYIMYISGWLLASPNIFTVSPIKTNTLKCISELEVENERLRQALVAVVMNSKHCQYCSASLIADKALEMGE